MPILRPIRVAASTLVTPGAAPEWLANAHGLSPAAEHGAGWDTAHGPLGTSATIQRRGPVPKHAAAGARRCAGRALAEHQYTHVRPGRGLHTDDPARCRAVRDGYDDAACGHSQTHRRVARSDRNHDHAACDGEPGAAGAQRYTDQTPALPRDLGHATHHPDVRRSCATGVAAADHGFHRTNVRSVAVKLARRIGARRLDAAGSQSRGWRVAHQPLDVAGQGRSSAVLHQRADHLRADHRHYGHDRQPTHCRAGIARDHPARRTASGGLAG